MKLVDPVYGEANVEPVLEELIKSKPVQRLKGIHQGGASYLVNPKWNVTRYEHSIGVMLLIRKLGGSIEEQIAGLLHDVSHTAFSHVIDFVFENKDEDYHEAIFKEVVQETELPTILSTYGYSYEEVLLDDSKWTILERPAPELCADRVDYTLRDMLTYGHISKAEVDAFLADLIVVDGRMFLQSISQAEWFVEAYYKEVIGFFMNPLNMYGYDRLGKALKYALHNELLKPKHFLLEDECVMNILKGSKDEAILTIIEELNKDVQLEENAHSYDFHRRTKVRLIDPSIYEKGQCFPASSRSFFVKRKGEDARQKAREGVYVNVLC